MRWWCLTSGIVDVSASARAGFPCGLVVAGSPMPPRWWGWGQAHCWVLKDQPSRPTWERVGVWLGFCSSLRLCLHVVGVWGLVGLLFEICIVDASIFCSNCFVVVCSRQAMKGTWWMPWHQEPMKDVGACDKPWGVGNRAVIRGCPNGETQLESCPVTHI